MKLRVLGCSGGSVKDRFLSCYLLNDHIALDAGGLAGPLTLDEQLGVGHVIVTHTHLDHNCGLPFFVDNIYSRREEPVDVYGTKAVVDSLKRHMFNDELWPDFAKLPTEDAPTLRFQEIEIEKPFTIGELTFTPIDVEHLIPTAGFLVEDGDSAIVYTSDTGPTDRVWEVASAQANLKAVITEVSFSNDAGALAQSSGHMTPDMLATELKKLTQAVRVLITHTKPGHLRQIEAELKKLNLPGVELCEQGKTYEF